MNYSVSAISMVRVVSLLFQRRNIHLSIPLSIVDMEYRRRTTRNCGSQYPSSPSSLLPNITQILDGFIAPQAHDSLKRSRAGNEPYALTRMNVGVNKSEVVSGRSGHSGRLNDDGRSELELVIDAAMPDGIQNTGGFQS